MQIMPGLATVAACHCRAILIAVDQVEPLGGGKEPAMLAIEVLVLDGSLNVTPGCPGVPVIGRERKQPILVVAAIRVTRG
jgi:hypothetical protein